MMRDAIQNFHTQFAYEPKIENGGGLSLVKKGLDYSIFIIAGMGGSHLAGGLLKTRKPKLPIHIYNDYDLPFIPNKANTLVIASSYSGNTEETVSAFEEARKRNVPIIAIATGGKLLELAKQYVAPYIEIPPTGIQPRSALGYGAKAFAHAMGETHLLQELTEVGGLLKPQDFEEEGRELAGRLKGYVPVIYASRRNLSIAYNWKIKFNETGKIPAFYNVFPELNHNEMTGFEVQESSRHLSERFYFIFIKSRDDHPRIQKRMVILEKQYKERGLNIEVLAVQGKSPFHALFSSLMLADWSALYTAEEYGLESEHVPMVEEFKKLMR